MWGGLRTLLVAPGRFYDEAAVADDLGYAIGVVGVVGLLALVQSALVTTAVLGSLDGGMGIVFAAGAVVGTLAATAGPFVAWLLYAAAFHGVTELYDADGAFRDTFVVVGWGFVPRIAARVVAVAITAVLVQQLPVGEGVRAAARFARLVRSHPLTLVSNGVSLVALAWSAWIWVAAVEHVRNVDRRRALLDVGLPVAVGGLLTVGPLALGLPG